MRSQRRHRLHIIRHKNAKERIGLSLDKTKGGVEVGFALFIDDPPFFPQPIP